MELELGVFLLDFINLEEVFRLSLQVIYSS